MDTNRKQVAPLPEPIKLRARRFGANAGSEFARVPVDPDNTSATRSMFQLRWEDVRRGLKVLIRENEVGRLIADVSCADLTLLGNAAVSVGLIGKVNDGLIRKTIPLDQHQSEGCGGCADFGLLADAVKDLGVQLAIVVFLLV